MWESEAMMLTLLKRLFLCFAESNVKYLNTTSSKSWSAYPPVTVKLIHVLSGLINLFLLPIIHQVRNLQLFSLQKKRQPCGHGVDLNTMTRALRLGH